MAVRNGAAYLSDALASLAAQSFRDFEIVLIDGHSTDSTAQIAQSFPGLRYFLQSEPGLPQAYQQGVDHARAPLLSWLSYDDIWLPNKLADQAQWLDANPHAGFVTGHTVFFLPNGAAPPPHFRPELLHGSHPTHIMETLMVRREVWNQLGGLRPELFLTHDVEFFSRAKDLNVPSGCLPQTILRKRIHGANTSLDLERNNRQILDAVRLTLLRKRRQR
jgi:glycosyltransferase involved in cell wall biosynthesis